MFSLLQKIPFLLELFFNGTFILLYSLKNSGKVPGNWNPQYVDNALEMGTIGIPLVIFLVVVANYLSSVDIEDFLRRYVFSLVVLIPLVITWGDLEFSFWLSSAHLLSSVLALYDDDPQSGPGDGEKKRIFKNQDLFQGLRLKPAQLVLFSFTGVILLGTFLLMLPVSAAPGKSLSFMDCLFISTSATCVTGLATLGINESFSLFGQSVILILIQIGGLSIMTLYSSMTILLGRSMGMKDRVIMQDLLDVSSLEELFAMIVDIIRYTFFIELWGAIVLTIAFATDGFELGQAFYYGVFHSISAFCNAGFSLFDNSLENYATNPFVHGTIAILIILGGLGFIVLKELKEFLAKRKSFVRLTLHTKTVLIVSFLLTFVGALFIFFGEFLDSLDQYSLWDKTQIALFQSVTLRTAGFNSIPLTHFNAFTIYGISLFMFIGASPGSTGGGIKTTTLAILIQSIVSTLKGKKKVGIFDRTIPGPMVVRATALTFISILITSFFLLLLMKTEANQDFLPLFFEVVSASGTVGLTLGVTSYLTTTGKFLISLLMLIGRIGPLTLIIAIGQRNISRGKLDYPDGRIMLG